MATPPSPEASEIRRRGRQRLIGAIAIVVLAVVFVPMILDSEPRTPRTEPALEIPAKENAPALPAPAPARTATPAAAAESAKPEAAAPKAVPAPAPTKAAMPAPQQPAAPKLEGFAVQVGAFKEEDKLKQARDRLAAAGLAHYVERRGDLTRLRAGPFPTREAADKALAAIKAASLEGQVVPLP